MNFLEYTNIVLQATNEVPLTEQQHQHARGLHQFVKEAINRAYFDIIGEYQWPWMQPGENDLSNGTPELSGERSIIPTTTWITIPVKNPYKDSIDWSSIYYRDTEGSKVSLKFLSWEEYEDNQDRVDSEGSPKYIVQSADGRSMGLFGLPKDPKGKLYYRVWSRPSRFDLALDNIPIPDSHYTVLVDGALHHSWSFRGETEQAQIAYARFEKGMKKMKQKYTNQSTRMRWI